MIVAVDGCRPGECFILVGQKSGSESRPTWGRIMARLAIPCNLVTKFARDQRNGSFLS